MSSKISMMAVLAVAAVALPATAQAQTRCNGQTIANRTIRGDLLANRCTLRNVTATGRIRFSGTGNRADDVRAGGNIFVEPNASLTANSLHAGRDILANRAASVTITRCTAGGNVEINRTAGGASVFVRLCSARGNLEIKESNLTGFGGIVVLESSANGDVRVVDNRYQRGTIFLDTNRANGNLTINNNRTTLGGRTTVSGSRLFGRLVCKKQCTGADRWRGQSFERR